MSYAKLAPLKYSYNQQNLARMYRAVALPHVLYLSSPWAIGLQVNGQKTEFLVFRSAKQEAPAPTVSVDGAIIAPSSLKYLGL